MGSGGGGSPLVSPPLRGAGVKSPPGSGVCANLCVPCISGQESGRRTERRCQAGVCPELNKPEILGLQAFSSSKDIFGRDHWAFVLPLGE